MERSRSLGGELIDDTGLANSTVFLFCSSQSQWYINQLEKNPLRMKMLTSGTLAGFQEFLASWLARDRNKHGNYFTSRVPKMAAYGALVSAPLGHFLSWCLQKTFRGRTSLRAKILQILASNLIVRFPQSWL